VTRYPRLPVESCRFVTTDRAELSTGAELSTSVRYALTANAVDALCAFTLAARESGGVRSRHATSRFAVPTPVAQER
jgi:hypothetical protein